MLNQNAFQTGILLLLVIGGLLVGFALGIGKSPRIEGAHPPRNVRYSSVVRLHQSLDFFFRERNHRASFIGPFSRATTVKPKSGVDSENFLLLWDIRTGPDVYSLTTNGPPRVDVVDESHFDVGICQPDRFPQSDPNVVGDCYIDGVRFIVFVTGGPDKQYTLPGSSGKQTARGLILQFLTEGKFSENGSFAGSVAEID